MLPISLSMTEAPGMVSVAMSAALSADLLSHLLRNRGAEDLAFALWTPSLGATRATALLHTIVLPEQGDRQVHGNASFNPQYLERVLDRAAKAGNGIAFLHSHLGPGWQGMSKDDVIAERRVAGAVASVTGLPLVGLTAGTDGAWSARFWFHEGGRQYGRRGCESVRVAGDRLQVTFDDRLVPPPQFRAMFRRTRAMWSQEGHQQLARLRIGIVGLGSVGMSLAENLARSGIERFALIDFDEIQEHNLDRLQGVDNRSDVGRLKIEVARRLIERSATAASIDVREVPFSVVEENGMRAALDCDVLFSCVDRPRARQMLNHLAYAHIIPVIDGGIAARFRDGCLVGAEWQTQTVAPGRRCLECWGAFDSGDADTERHGKLDDPSYLKGLPHDHRLKANENVFAFSTHLASMEAMQLIGLAAGIPQIASFGAQRMFFFPGVMENDLTASCIAGCTAADVTGTGDSLFTLAGRDHAADAARARQRCAG